MQGQSGTASDSTRPRGSNRSTFAILASLVILVMICAGGFVLIGRAMLRMTEAQMEVMECSHQMERIAMALEAYHGDYSVYPPAIVQNARGRPAHSWRVLLLPYLDEENLYEQYRFDEPWDGPNNRRLAQEMPLLYGCPCDPGLLEGQTSYLAIYDPVTRQFSAEPTSTSNRPAAARRRPTARLLLIEVCESGVGWLEPKDIAFTPGRRTGLARRTRFSYHPSASSVIGRDGNARLMTDADIRATLPRASKTPGSSQPATTRLTPEAPAN